MREGEIDALVFGPLIDYDVVMAEALSKLGFRCVVVRAKSSRQFDASAFPIKLSAFRETDIVVLSGIPELIKLIRSSHSIVSLGGTFTSFFGRLYFLAVFFPFPPIFNIATGSDLTEMALERSVRGWVYRWLLRKAVVNLVAPHTAMLDAVAKLRINNFIFMRYPYPIAELCPTVGNAADDRIVYLHASNLDWGVADPGEGRVLKRNDVFIKAFLRAAEAGARVRCIILDRGPDRMIARQMIEASPHADKFKWRREVLPSELPALMQQADVVVDQFQIGGLGGIAMEAMGQAKAVMTYVHDDAYTAFYDDLPPLLNCLTEDEVFEKIVTNSDRSALKALGQRGRAWVLANHCDQHDVRELALRIRLASDRSWRAIGINAQQSV